MIFSPPFWPSISSMTAYWRFYCSDSRYQPPALLPSSTTKTHRVHSARKYCGSSSLRSIRARSARWRVSWVPSWAWTYYGPPRLRCNPQPAFSYCRATPSISKDENRVRVEWCDPEEFEPGYRDQARKVNPLIMLGGVVAVREGWISPSRFQCSGETGIGFGNHWPRCITSFLYTTTPVLLPVSHSYWYQTPNFHFSNFSNGSYWGQLYGLA